MSLPLVQISFSVLSISAGVLEYIEGKITENEWNKYDLIIIDVRLYALLCIENCIQNHKNWLLCTPRSYLVINKSILGLFVRKHNPARDPPTKPEGGG